MEHLHIRTYTPADRGTILGLLRLNTPAYFAPEEEQDLVYYLANESEWYYVAELDGKPVGCGGINYTEDGKTGRISWDIVHPDHQGKGIGRRLTEFRIAKMLENEQVERLSVRTSQLVFPFYEKLGFELNEIVKDYWAPGFDLYHLERNR
jgi:[ribosomal protein S18]-alanine N-acetyltransferase